MWLHKLWSRFYHAHSYNSFDKATGPDSHAYGNSPDRRGNSITLSLKPLRRLAHGSNCGTCFSLSFCTMRTATTSKALACYLSNPSTYCLDVDSCASPGPCLNGGQCEDRYGGYTCNCTDDYFGINCTYREREYSGHTGHA